MAGTKNQLNDLNNHLFEQMERLNDDGLQGEELKQEILRSQAMTDIASQIVANGQLALKAMIARNKYLGKAEHMPRLLEE